MHAFATRLREWRSAALVVFFLALTAGVLLGLALVVGSQIGSSIRAETLRGAVGTAEVFFSITFEPDDYEGGRLRPRMYRKLNENVGVSQSIVGARLWDARTGLLHESGAARLGALPTPSLELRAAFRGGVRSEVAPEPAVSSGKEVRTYAPVPTRRGPAKHVVELDSPYEPVARDIAA